MNIDIAKLNTVELQALGYQFIATYEQKRNAFAQAERNLVMVNQEIARRKAESPNEDKGLMAEVESLVNTKKPNERG